MTSTDTSAARQPKGLWRSRWAAVGAAVAVSLGAGGVFVANAVPGPAESTLVAVTPERILDSRDPNNVGLAGPFVSAVSQKLQVTGSIPTATGTKTVVPAGATGVLMNVTSVGATASGFVSIRPGDATGTPTTSSLNITAGVIVPNSVQVAMPTTGPDAGKIEITFDAFGVAGPTTDLLIDVVGYTTNTGLQQLVADTKPLFATINSSGTVREGRASRLVSSTRIAVGEYKLTFDRDLQGCAVTTADLIFASNRDVSAEIGFSGDEDAVDVRVRDTANAPVDTYFHVMVLCPQSGAAALVSGEAEDSPND